MEIDKFLDEKFAAENDQCRFYTNNFTRSASDYAVNRWHLENYYVLVAELKKSNERSYILVNEQEKQIVYSTENYEALVYHIDMLGLANQSEDQTTEK